MLHGLSAGHGHGWGTVTQFVAVCVDHLLSHGMQPSRIHCNSGTQLAKKYAAEQCPVASFSASPVPLMQPVHWYSPGQSRLRCAYMHSSIKSRGRWLAKGWGNRRQQRGLLQVACATPCSMGVSSSAFRRTWAVATARRTAAQAISNAP